MTIKVKMIFACSYNKQTEEHAFGNKGKLPWSFLKQDMEIYKEYTKNSILIMGSKTFESLPKKHRDLVHIVISRKHKSDCRLIVNKSNEMSDYISDTTAGAITFAKELITENQYENINEICLIGGAGLLHDNRFLVDEICISEIVTHKPLDYDVTINVKDMFEGKIATTHEKIEIENHKEVSTINKYILTNEEL